MILCELYWSSLQQEAQQLDLQQSTILEALHVELRQQGLCQSQSKKGPDRGVKRVHFS